MAIETNPSQLQRTSFPPAIASKNRPAPAIQAVAADLGTDTYQAASSQLAKAATSQASSPLRHGNHLELLVDGAEAYPAIHRQIESAKTRIDMEFFSFHDDGSGRRVAEKLMAKAKSGVEVNVLLDYLSNRNNDLLKEMEAAGVRVKHFTNGHKSPVLHLNDTTNHRKVLLVDGKVGITGGMNIGERYEKYWHDLMVKVEGPTISDFYDRFHKNWELSGGEALRPLEMDLAPKGIHAAQVAVTSPTEHEIKKSLASAFDNAQKRILISSPYFIDNDLVESLKKASNRGVKVHAILPTVGDNPMVDIMNESVVNELLDSGVRVHRYDTKNPNISGHNHLMDHFNHGKVAVVDGYWTMIGTANADTRSMIKNQEINLHVASKKFGHEVEKRVFGHDFRTKAPLAKKIEFSKASWPVRAALKALSFLF